MKTKKKLIGHKAIYTGLGHGLGARAGKYLFRKSSGYCNRRTQRTQHAPSCYAHVEVVRMREGNQTRDQLGMANGNL
jgi:hypothetical protein